MRSPDAVDLAIVGLGPVGAVAAHLAGVHGLSVLAFDREPDVYELPRAAVIDDEVQRILATAGVLDAVRPHAVLQRGAEFVDSGGRRIMGLEIPDGLRTPNGHPPLLGINQPGFERAVRSCLASHSRVTARVAHEVRAIAHERGGVTLTVCDRAAGTERRVEARWLLGCDGARSMVRRECGIAWDSLGYDHQWLVVDLEILDDHLPLPVLVQQICDPERPTTFVPLPGRLRRWEFQLRPEETGEEMERPERVWSLLAPWLTPRDAVILRAVVYRFHATIAGAFRAGPIFLAGDAAHQTPPFLGQGMCTGIRDVANLLWKIAAVREGVAGDRLLDTYEAERRPMAIAMVEHSVAVGRLIDAYAAMERGGPPPSPELREAGYGGRRTLPHLASGLVREDPWSGRLVPQGDVPTASGRAPLDVVVGPRWAMLSGRDPRGRMSRESRRTWDRLGAAILTVPEPDGALLGLLAAHEAVVVRPDRYVYAVTTNESDLDTITTHLECDADLPPARS